MRIFPEKYRIIIWISLVLYAAFAVTGIAAYFLARNAEQQDIVEQALPLTSDAVHAAIRAEALRPVLVAAMIASDNRVRDWLLEGEADNDAIVRYLEEIRNTHGAQGVFLASERTRKRYGADGAVIPLQENSAQDAWFFRVRESRSPFLAAFSAGGNRNAATLSVYQRVLDKDGNFLAAAGVTINAERLMRIVDSYRQPHGSRIHIVDAQRRIMPESIAGSSGAQTIDALPGMRDIAGALLHGGNAPVQLQYQRDGGTVYVSARFMPEFGWHLLVERNDSGTGAGIAQQLLVSSLLIGGGITVLVVVLLLLTINRYHERLEQMAGSDPLTGLLNRQAFDIVFRQVMLEAERNGRPLSGILFDVDFIKQVNEIHGYAAGDEILRTVARIGRALLRESDVFARWNGEEFFVLLKECRVEQAVVVAEKIRQEVDQHDFSAVVPDGHITISLGVVQHDVGETASLFFSRVDEALYKAKMNGRNRLQVALSSGDSSAETTTAA